MELAPNSLVLSPGMKMGVREWLVDGVDGTPHLANGWIMELNPTFQMARLEGSVGLSGVSAASAWMARKEERERRERERVGCEGKCGHVEETHARVGVEE